jgi:hypothetical protein
MFAGMADVGVGVGGTVGVGASLFVGADEQ